jgi:hypothetical protein
MASVPTSASCIKGEGESDMATMSQGRNDLEDSARIKSALKKVQKFTGCTPVVCVSRNLISFEDEDLEDETFDSLEQRAAAWETEIVEAFETLGLEATVQVKHGNDRWARPVWLTLAGKGISVDGLVAALELDQCDCDLDAHSNDCQRETAERAIELARTMMTIESAVMRKSLDW